MIDLERVVGAVDSDLGQPALDVLVTEDHGVTGHAITVLLAQRGISATAVDGQTLSSALRRGSVPSARLVLLDLDLDGGLDGVTLVAPLVAAGRLVVVCTGETDPARLGHALAEGATALLRKGGPARQLVDAIVDLLEHPVERDERERHELLCAYRRSITEDVERLRPFATMTIREKQVLAALMDGVSAAAIARAEGCSVKTVRHHIENILTKLGASSQLKAVSVARAAGWHLDAGASALR